MERLKQLITDIQFEIKTRKKHDQKQGFMWRESGFGAQYKKKTLQLEKAEQHAYNALKCLMIYRNTE